MLHLAHLGIYLSGAQHAAHVPYLLPQIRGADGQREFCSFVSEKCMQTRLMQHCPFVHQSMIACASAWGIHLLHALE